MKRTNLQQSRNLGPALVRMVALLALLTGLFVGVGDVHADGVLTVDIIAGYNLVVDSNVSSPSTYAPSVATVIGKFCNTGDAPLTNVYGYIGDGSTAGTYPQVNTDAAGFSSTYPNWTYLAGSGIYAFNHVGSAADASREIGTIPVGECRYQYWSFEYPACENDGSGNWENPPCTSGDPLWGTSVKPDDDFALQFYIWGDSDQNSASTDWTMTMRNEISAMANKIEPNPNGRWFNTEDDTVEVGDVITTNGILYTLGNVRFGFDNDTDYDPDYNAWLQPISQPDFDPECFRLIDVTGVLTVTRGGGNPDMYIPIDKSLYFTDLPPDNTSVDGKVYYKFLALKGPCSMGLTPYQEVASGFDNEKFNGDYGLGIPTAYSEAPLVTIDKSSAPDTLALGGTTTYNIPFANTGSADAGLTLASGYGVEMPLVVEDVVPDGMQYVGSSATYSLNAGTATIRYSTDSGANWSTSDPGTTLSTWPNNKVIIQWRLDQPLPAGSTGNYAQFQATVPGGPTPPAYAGTPFIENTACIGLGDADPFACDTALTLVEGTGTIGDFVWRDENNDGQQTGEETYGINGVTVSLYWDRLGDGELDDDDVLLFTQDTTTNVNAGYYQFTDLPAGDFLVVVDSSDVQALHPGYRLTTPELYAITLAAGGSDQTADFGYGPSLTMEKRMLAASDTCGGYEGQEVVYSIALTNQRPGTGEAYGGGCRFYVWPSTGSTANPPKDFTDYTSAFGKPDDTYAYGDFSIGSNRWIQGTGFDPSGSGTIGSVDAVFRVYVDPALSDDYAVARLYQGTTELASYTFSTAELNTHVGQANAGYLEWLNIPGTSAPGGSWDWSDFSLLTVQLEPEKTGGADASILYIDAMGFRVTSSDPCPAIDENDIMTTVPLQDTYDTTRLQFISATPSPSAPPSAGVISWDNVGPIYPGETKTVYVRFLALDLVNGTSSVTVNNEASVTGAEFADGGAVNDVSDTESGTICPTGSINGYVYSDLGTQGWNYVPGTDLPIQDVQVTLYGCYDQDTGALITAATAQNSVCTSSQNNGVWSQVGATQLTDANGYYAFNGLLDGFYYVQVTASDLPGTVSQTAEADDDQSATGTLPNTTADGHTCSVANPCNSIWGNPAANLRTTTFNPINSPGETINGVNFGYTINAGAYGSVWEDNNGDGDKDSGEGPIGSVTVWLYASSDCSGTPVQTTATNANGRYQFGDLTAGNTYCIAVDTSSLPGGATAWSQTGESDGSINNQITFTAVAGTLSGSHDFGFRHVGSYTIGDTLYYDWNGDGTQQSNEEGIPNVRVSLYEDSNGNGVIDAGIDAFIADTTTDNVGFYEFTGLPGDNYLVIVDTDDTDFPSSVVETQDPDEAGVCTTCDSRGKADTTGGSVDDIDFGYQPKGVGSIGDTVWRDMNGDGVQGGATETGIANITVWLEVDLNGDGTYARVETAVTDADGKYLFSDLPDGNYRVVVDDTDTDLPTGPYGNPYYPSTVTTTGQITISNGNSYLDADFGFAPGGAIGDRVWEDTNGNGNQDEDEPGISGVVVRLYTWEDTNGNGYYDAGDTLVDTGQTDTTDSNGLYLFSGLPADDYVVRVESGIPSGFTQSGDPDWLEPCTGTGLCDGASGVSLRAGQIDLSRDFGYQPPGVIGDYVWFDSDADGVQDEGEGGIGYVTVYLDEWNGSGWDLAVESTETDSDGYYSFGDLTAGTYRVRVDTGTLPTGVTATYDRDDGTSSPDSIVTDIVMDANGDVTEIDGTACTGDCNLEMDFGYRYYDTNGYSISGHVFFDAGSTTDGTDDTYVSGTDTPYEGIPVYLWRDGKIVAATTTDSNGYYSFGNLPAGGDYTVAVDRSGRLNLLDLTATPNNTPEVKSFVTITNLSSNVTDQDFGFYEAIDYGDLPDSYYDTLVASQGAGHIVGSLRLGATVTTEANGQPSTEANLDTDDGITFVTAAWTPGTTVELTANVVGSNGYLVGWFDWDGDGAFGAGEMVDFSEMTSGDNTIYVDIPAGADTSSGYVYMRFRLYDRTTMSTISPNGLATNGEVEDYRRSISPTAVELAGFWATAQDGAVLLTWETATELDNLGFNLYRAESPTGPRVRLNSELIPSQVPGSPLGAIYERLDGDVRAGIGYYYWLEAVDVYGHTMLYGPVSASLAPGSYGNRVFLPLIGK